MKADRKRLERFLGRLVAAYRKREYPFNLEGVEPPQRLIPDEIKANSKTYAFFLFTLCLWMRGRVDSDTATKCLVGLYEADEKFFDPHWVQHCDPVFLEDYLRDYGLGTSAKQNAEFWVSNARLLVQRWHGDPRLIFHDFGRYKSDLAKWNVALKRIANQGTQGRKGGFAGFQEKMVSMLIYFLMEEGLIPYFDHPVPVDIHVTRLMAIHRIYDLEWNVLYTGKRLKVLLDAIRLDTYYYAKRNGVSSIELDNALWLFSRSMCSESPGFITEEDEHNHDYSQILPRNPKWTEAEDVAYARTCGACVVRNTCEGTVRHVFWSFKRGIVLEPQHRSPQGILIPPEEHAQIISTRKVKKIAGTSQGSKAPFTPSDHMNELFDDKGGE